MKVAFKESFAKDLKGANDEAGRILRKRGVNLNATVRLECQIPVGQAFQPSL